MANTSTSTPYKGDSGGPLTIQDATYGTLLVGLVSYTSDPISPTSGNTFYTNVGTYLSWIYQMASTISGPAIAHNQGSYSLAKTFNPSITPTWTSSSTNIATINSSGQLIRKGTASGEITI